MSSRLGIRRWMTGGSPVALAESSKNRHVAEANSLHISDLKVTTGEKVAVGGGGNGDPAQANVNVEHSEGIKAYYEAARVIHGLINGSDSGAIRTIRGSSAKIL
ncbi:hypothetical protein GB937_006148 [Aspergillus fischeri]|nr:hypothetical protein GB937_006148 [Aspergillus fischeri]